MSDSAFVGQQQPTAADSTEAASNASLTVTSEPNKPIDLVDPAIVSAVMSSSPADGEDVTDNVVRPGPPLLTEAEINDPKLADVISDIATSSSPEQQESDNGAITDESGSGEMSSNDSTELILDSHDHPTIQHKNVQVLQREVDPVLPSTVTVLDGPDDSKVYLVGTAHFSEESQKDVEETIRKTQPNTCVLELCRSRLNVLSLDERTIMEETKNMNFAKMQQSIKENGLVPGIMYLLLLNLSAHLTKELGMAPGGEFRRAFNEAQKVPGCVMVLGDRPVGITLQRAISSLSLWQKIRLGFSMLFSKESITREEVEKCKQKDLLEEMMAEITGEFPALSEVFVGERDKYLAYSLYLAAHSVPDVQNGQGTTPQVVVGVVGIGHVQGIVSHWGKVKEEDIPALLEIKPESLASKVIVKGIKYSISGLLIFGAYKYILPNSVKGICLELAEKAWASIQCSLSK